VAQQSRNCKIAQKESLGVLRLQFVRLEKNLSMEIIMKQIIPILFLSLIVSASVFADGKPNVVLIISDDHAWFDHSFIRHDAPSTPNIDRLAQEGITFTRGYVPTALCRASLMSFVTGLYANQHWTAGNDPNQIPDQEQYNQHREALISHIDSLPTLPKMLKEAGYTSLQTGKWWEGNFSRGGFDEGMTRGFPQPGGRHGDDGLSIGRTTMQPIDDFIDRNKERPFFIWYAPMMPHDPHTPPQEILDKYLAKGYPAARANYEAMVEWFDQTVGQLVDKLKQSGVYDNTVIIYSADNGWIPPSPEASPPGWKKSFAIRSKLSPYEGGVRTPIIFHYPKEFKPRRDDATLVSTLDLVPTILSLTGAGRPEMPKELALPGLDLTDFLKTGTPLNRNILFGEAFGHDVPDVNDAVKGRLHRWCIEGEWKLLLSDSGDPGTNPEVKYDTDQPQLFDLSHDPAETKNLAQEHPDLVKRLKDKIDQWSPAP
jgi:uncharacterized sulfatase